MVTLGTVTTSSNNLERKGYIQRTRFEVEQSRAIHLSFTKRGKPLYRLHQQFHKRMVNNSIIDGMPPDETESDTKGCRTFIVS